MKKLLSVVLCFSMIFALCVPAFAVETDQENMSQEFSAVDEFLTTNEDAMPPVPDFSVQTTNPVSTLNMPSRAAWVKNTTETLESAYISKREHSRTYMDGRYISPKQFRTEQYASEGY